ncbi:MAG TPA: GNAT family N-acetyltransferase [Bacteroidia bacterium]|nr:GNAT family N-acetyltransferase [Bacteroidia bacterium]
MKNIIAPISREILLNELSENKFVRVTNNGTNHIYITTYQESPNLLLEIGRLRELTFRDAGGGTGKEVDIDEFDTAKAPYKQLIVWNPEEKEIVGGYRFIKCGEAPKDKNGTIQLATTELFRFHENFISNYLPYTIELGRSFVQTKYQPSVNNRKGLFSLDNLWDGLGAIVVDNPDINYFFGKVTMYTDFNREARDMILYFLKKYFPDTENLVNPLHPLSINSNTHIFEKMLGNSDYKNGHKILNQFVRAHDENIPPLVNAYMNLSATMKTFGTANNDTFGDVEETGILVSIADIYPTKKERHINSYQPKK